MQDDGVGVDGVMATMLITVCARALAPKLRPDIGFADPFAERIVMDLGIDPHEYCTFPGSLIGTACRSTFFDRVARGFFERHPDGRGINLGCGLGTIFDRIADAAAGRFRWFDVDLPPVIAVRRRFFRDDGRRTMLEADVCDPASLIDVLSRDATGRPTLVIMEGLLYYLDESDVGGVFHSIASVADRSKSLCEMAFDVASPTGVVTSNLRNTDTARTGSLMRWGFRGLDNLRRWDSQLTLVEKTDHRRFVPEELRPLFLAKEEEEGLPLAAQLHLARRHVGM